MSEVNKKKYCVVSTTEGCATNLVENSQYKNSLGQSGAEVVSNVEEADVVIYNTCGYSQQMEDRAISEIKKVRDLYPNKKIVVGGCLPSINKDSLKEVYEGDTFRPGDIKKLFSLSDIKFDVIPKFDEQLGFDPNDFSTLSFKHRLLNSLRTIYFKFENIFGGRFQPLSNIVESAIVNNDYQTITVSTGCLGECSFCSIKMAKGSVKSRTREKIVEEIRKGIASGKKKFWLLGDDIGCYGQDIGDNIANLLEEILKIKDEFSLVLNYMEPMFLEKYYDRLIILLEDTRVKNINFPIQSGSKKIVFSMRRFYHPHNILKMMTEIRKVNSELVRKTNIIVGYPGETFSDFFESLKSVFYFDALVAFRFTPRKHSLAAKLPNQLGGFVIGYRFWVINTAIFIRHAFIALSSLKNRITS